MDEKIEYMIDEAIFDIRCGRSEVKQIISEPKVDGRIVQVQLVVVTDEDDFI